METNLRNQYYIWILDKIGHDGNYNSLLELLNRVHFTYIVDMDANRYEDGISLRYRFCRENKMEFADVIAATHLDTEPCTMLEMMGALALRIEEDIMVRTDSDDPNTWQWFNSMLVNSGLSAYDDSHYDYDAALEHLYTIIYRKYEPDGTNGGLFVIYDPPKDLRTVEIWYQAMWWLNQYI